MGKGLPKKYAKMGFKKGWAAYRRAKGSRKTRRKSSPVRKTRKVRRVARKKKGGGRKSPSLITMARGGMYAATIAVPAYVAYTQHRAAGDDAGQAIVNTVQSYAGLNRQNQFDWGVVTQMYAPPLAWGVADFILGKLGIWRKAGRMLRL